jgi:hypothetical protein
MRCRNQLHFKLPGLLVICRLTPIHCNRDDTRQTTAMTEKPNADTRWRLLRDVVVFQLKLGMEAVLDLTLIPTSLAAAALDLLLGNWRRPRWFHAVLRFGERCEHWIDLWGVATPGSDAPPSEVDALVRSVETMIRNPRTGPGKVRELRRWAAAKIAPSDEGGLPSIEQRSDPPT